MQIISTPLFRIFLHIILPIFIGILTYNLEDYVAVAIESVLQQKTDFEYKIIISDDNSTDGTVEILKEYYPDAVCSLDFTTPFEMMVAVMLSAQCTDERVNKTTPSLFEKYKTLDDFCNAEQKILEQDIEAPP